MCEATARTPGSDCPILPTISGLPACSAFSAARDEGRGRLHVLKQQQEDVGPAFVDQIIEHVADFERGFVAGRDDMAELQYCAARARSKKAKPRPPLCEMTETWPLPSARVRRERPGFLVQRRAEGRAQAGGDIGEAFRVRPADGHVVAARDRAICACMRAPASPGSSAKPEERMTAALMPARAAAFQFGGDELGRNDEHGEIDALGQRLDRRIGLQALHLRRAAAHRIDLAAVRMAEHDFEDAPAQPLQIVDDAPTTATDFGQSNLEISGTPPPLHASAQAQPARDDAAQDFGGAALDRQLGRDGDGEGELLFQGRAVAGLAVAGRPQVRARAAAVSAPRSCRRP